MLEENKILKSITGRFIKPGYQLNKVLESDAEIIRLGESYLLAITTDSIVEEISTGLYTDPYLIGWMTVVVNLSDLAAVGAKPLGLVINQSFPSEIDNEIIDSVQKGIQDACNAHQSYILGGDTNKSDVWNMSGTAIGVIEDDSLMCRKGADISDLIYTTGESGIGNVFAFNHFFNNQEKITFAPKAKLKESAVIRKWASSCIDSSDGLIPALCNIMELNQCGAELSLPVEDLVCAEAKSLSEKFQIPEWIFLAGPHGDYELVFTVRSENVSDFEEVARKNGFEFRLIGKCIPGNEISFSSGSYQYHGDPFIVANEFARCNNDPKIYFNALLKIDQQWKK